MPGDGPLAEYQELRLCKRAGDMECEDAGAAHAPRGRFAIADGASESSFAGAWARLLVEGFVDAEADPIYSWPGWLPPFQKRWAAAVAGGPLPWYAEAKLEQGAFATLLGVVLERTRCRHSKRWRALAVGDSCLFQVRADSLRRSFPLRSAADFDNSPWLVGSRPGPGGCRQAQEVRAQGYCRKGDKLWLMTDALAQWFLRQTEVGAKPWEALSELLSSPDPQQAFAVWVSARLNKQELRNDDLTLLAISP